MNEASRIGAVVATLLVIVGLAVALVLTGSSSEDGGLRALPGSAAPSDFAQPARTPAAPLDALPGEQSSQLGVYDLHSGEEEAVGYGRLARWSPDGEHIALVADREGASYGGQGSIYSMDADGLNLQWHGDWTGSDGGLPCTGSRIDYGWAPDSQSLVVWEGNETESSMVVSSLLPGVRRRTLLTGAFPAFSPDGNVISYLAYEDPLVRTEPGCRLFGLDLESNTPRMIAGWEDIGPERIGRYDWSPDGSRIAFSSSIGVSASGAEDPVKVVSISAGQVTELGGGHDPEWSPDGSRIAYFRSTPLHHRGALQDGEQAFLVVEEVTGNEPEIQIELPERSFSFSWSPDGTQLAFDAIEGPGLYGVWIVDLAKPDAPLRLVAGREPDWSPDGGSILFSLDLRYQQPIE